MPTRQVCERGHGDEHQGEQHAVVPWAPAQQQGIGRLVDGEAAGRDEREAAQRSAERRAVVAEGPAAVAGERDGQRQQPGRDVGGERWPLPLADDRNDAEPVHRRGDAADDDEAADASDVEAGAVGFGHGAAQDTPRRSLCVGIDDFGLHRGINEAAQVLMDLNRVHAVSCLVGGSAWPVGAARLRARGGHEVDVGLHLDLTEAPLVTGARRSLAALIAACSLRLVDRPSIRREIDAQLDAFEDAIGRAPSHVDGHQHVHQFAVVREELLGALQRRYRDPLPWLRSTRRPAGRQRAAFKAWVIERLGARALEALAARRGFAHNAHLLGIHDFRSSELQYAELAGGWLAAAGNADLLVCHASVCAIADDPVGASRRHEFDVLRSAWWGRCVRQHGITLAPLSRRLAAQPPGRD
jgi:chitin disaccharide deacetylase